MSEDIVIQTTDTTVDITSGESVDIDTTETTIDIDGDQSVDISVEESTVEIEVTGGQGPPGEGDVSSSSAITDNAIVRGDGGSKGVQDSGITISDTDEIANIRSASFTLVDDPEIVEGQIAYDSEDGTFDVGLPGGVVGRMFQEIFFDGKNQTGADIPDGTPIMFASPIGASGKVEIQPAIADGSIPSEYIMGIATETIANGEFGKVTWFGKVRGLDTTGTPYGETWAIGDLIYVGMTAGSLTNVEPNVPGQIILVAAVLVAHAKNGVLLLRPTWNPKLTDLDDVNGTTPDATNKFLVWNNVNDWWDADKITAADIIYEGTETVEEILDETINQGVLHAVTITDNGGLDISWSVAEVFVKATNTIIDTEAGSGTCTDNTTNWLKWVSGTTLTLSATKPTDDEIFVANIHCQAGDVWTINYADRLDERESRISTALSEMFPSIVTTGLITSEDTDGTSPWDVILSAGRYYLEGHLLREILAPVYSRISGMTAWYKVAGVWTSASVNVIDPTMWVSAGTLTATSIPKYYRSPFIVVNGGLHWVYPETEYDTIAQAEAGVCPARPPGLDGYPASTCLILKGNATALPAADSEQWIDVRPKIGSSVSTSTSDHGNLGGLPDDDHTQYALLAGRAGGQTITGGTAASENLTLSSTANATKGKIVFGTSAYDEVNNRLGLGVTAPANQLTQKSAISLESAPLGSELLSSSNWTSTGWTGDFATGFSHTTGNTTALTNTLAATTNNLYQIAFTVTGRTAGTFTVTFGSVTSPSYSATSAWGVKATGTGTLSFTPTTDFNGTLVISIKQITGTYSATYAIQDSTGANAFEIRNSLASLNNSFVGAGAGRYNTTGSNNSAQGFSSLYSNTTGYNNAAQGPYSLYSNTTGYQNAAQGASSLRFNTTGYNNAAQGFYSGSYIASGAANATSNNSVFLGYDTRAEAAGQTNQIVIGASAVGNGSNSVTLGNTSITKTVLRGGVEVTNTVTTQPSVLIKNPAAHADNSFEIQDSTGTVLCSIDESGEIEVTDSTKGVILSSPDATRWRITVDNTGALTTTSL